MFNTKNKMVVKTKADFEKAVKLKPKKIIFKGKIAKDLSKELETRKKRNKWKKILTGAGVVGSVIAGIALAIPSGGASLTLPVLASGLTIKTGKNLIELTLGEVAILSGVVVTALGVSRAAVIELLRQYDIIKLDAFGGKVEATRKN